MKKILLFGVVVTMAIFGCRPQQSTGMGSCHVKGTVSDSLMEGHRIVIEPIDMSKTSVKSDTFEIKGGKFEATLDSVLVYKVMPVEEYLYATLQPIIIVGEPGVVWVRLGPDSHSGGTVQNDTLDSWKILTEAHSRVYNQIRSKASMMAQKGDTIQAGILQKEADSLHFAYSSVTRRMADAIGEGPLYVFLSRFFQ